MTKLNWKLVLFLIHYLFAVLHFAVAIEPSTQLSPCPPEDFRCLSHGPATAAVAPTAGAVGRGIGECVSAWRVCDGVADCADASDERLCETIATQPCADTQWLCADAHTCILRDWRCDGVADCDDSSDEVGCRWLEHRQCGVHEMRCRYSGVCLDSVYRCDGSVDCDDGTDEIGCVVSRRSPCESGDFWCHHHGLCINSSLVCDGSDDCGDGSDEFGCRRLQCDALQFQCESVCIPSSFVCDGSVDCDDGRDEANCSSSTSSLANSSLSVTPAGSCPDDQLSCWPKAALTDSTSNVRHALPAAICLKRYSACEGVASCEGAVATLSCVSCSGPSLFSCNDGQCLPSEYRCDGFTQCSQQEDERNCPLLDECPRDSPCQHVCLATHNNSTHNGDVIVGDDVIHLCGCRAGYSLQSDGFSCEPWSACETDAICSQRCSDDNNGGRVSCHCVGGYSLRPDRVSCGASSHLRHHRRHRATILLSLRHAILQLSTRGELISVVHKHLANAVHLDYLIAADLLFWTDTAHNTIYSSRLNGSHTTALFSSGLFEPSGLAVDWQHSLLYWTDAKHHAIIVSSLDGSVRHSLRVRRRRGANDDDDRNDSDGQNSDEVIRSPRAIALYPSRALVFWTQVGGGGSVHRCDGDGGNWRRIVDERGAVWPNGVTVDYGSERVYWTDAGLHAVWSSRLDGSLRRKVVGPVPHPYSISVFDDLVYWTDWKLSALHSASWRRDGAVSTLRSSLDQPMEVRVLHPLRQPTDSLRRCAPASGARCSHLCVPRAQGHRCVCPDGLQMKTDSVSQCEVLPRAAVLAAVAGGIYMLPITNSSSSSSPTSSSSASTASTAVPLQLPEIRRPAAVDCDALGQLFWADSGGGGGGGRSLLATSRWDGSRASVLADTNLGNVTGLAVDWLNEKLYWVDAGLHRLEVLATDSLVRLALITRHLHQPSAIAVWPPAGWMFWSQLAVDSDGGGGGYIETAQMNGVGRRVVMADAGTPVALAVDSVAAILFWCDTYTDSIGRAGLSRDGHVTWLRRGASLAPQHRPVSLTVVDSVVYYGDSVSGRVLLWSPLEPTAGNNTNFLAELPALTAGVPMVLAALSARERRWKQHDTHTNGSHHADVHVTHDRLSHGCLHDNGGCSHLCLLSVEDKPSCHCATGISLLSDGRTCETTPAVILLASCRSTVRRVTLTQHNSSSGAAPHSSSVASSPDVVLPLDRGSSVVAIAWDALHGLLYYWDVTPAHATIGGHQWLGRRAGARIMSSSLQGRRRTPIIVAQLGTLGSMDIDSAGRKLYWADVERASVEVCELDGSRRRLLVHGDLDMVRSLTVSHSAALMYWTQWTREARIQRAWMDGTHREDVITERLGRPAGVVVDAYSGAIYWCDNQLGTVETSSLTGSNRHILVSDARQPFSMALFDGRLFWSERAPFNSVRHVAVGNHKSPASSPVQLLLNISNVDHIIIAERDRAITRDACGGDGGDICDKGGALCLRTPGGSTCVCPTGLPLLADNITCSRRPPLYLLYLTQTSLNRVALHTEHSAGTTWPVTLATSGVRNAVWLDVLPTHTQAVFSDTALNRLSVTSLDGGEARPLMPLPAAMWPLGVTVLRPRDLVLFTCVAPAGVYAAGAAASGGVWWRRRLVWHGVDEPGAVAASVTHGRMFWADTGGVVRLETALLDGTERRVLVTQQLVRPSALTTDSDRLYWSDVQLGWISSCLLSGADRRVIVRHLPHPFSLAVIEDRLYWSDWHRQTIESSNKFTGLQRSVIVADAQGVTGMTAVFEATVDSSPSDYTVSACLHDNGGCLQLCLERDAGQFSCLCADSAPSPGDGGTNSSTVDCRDQYRLGRATAVASSSLWWRTSLVAACVCAAATALAALLVAAGRVWWRHRSPPHATLTFSNPSYTADTRTSVQNDGATFVEHVTLVEVGGVRL